MTIDWNRFRRPSSRPSLARPFEALPEPRSINFSRFRSAPEEPVEGTPGMDFGDALTAVNAPASLPKRKRSILPDLPLSGPTDIVTRADRPNFSIGGALKKGALDPGTAEGRAIRDREVQAAAEKADRRKREFLDVAFTPAQAALGAGRNIAAKADALLPDEIGGTLPRYLREGADDLSATMQREGGAIPFLQAGSNMVGNIGSEIALFRGVGKLAGKGAEALANVDKATGISTTLGRAGAGFDRLSKTADAERGLRGVAMRTGRDWLANLPINLVNAADRDLSAAGGFADISEQFGGDKSQGKTGWLDRVSKDPLKRVGFELALDAGIGLPVEAGLAAFRRRDPLEELAERIRKFKDIPEKDRSAERAAARQAAGSTFIPTEGTGRQRVVVEGPSAPESPEVLPTQPEAPPTPPVEPQPPAAAGPEPMELDTPPKMRPIRPPLVEDPQVLERGWRVGREVPIRFSDGTRVRGRYVLATLDDLIPSHDPFSYRLDPRYPEGVQGRAYDRDAGAQQANQLRAAELDPWTLLDPSFTPEKGPPTITREGIVVAGNDRAMAMKRAKEQFPERWREYRQKVLEEASAYGIDVPAGVLDEGEMPVLVRVLDDDTIDDLDPETLRRLNAASDTPDTKAKSALDQAATKAQALRQGRSALDHLAQTLDPDSTVSEYLKGAAGRQFVQRLVDDGVITPAELSQYVNVRTNTLTENGRTLLRDTLLVAALDDTAVISRAPASVVSKLEWATLPMLKVRDTEWDIAEVVRGALDQIARAKANNIKLEDLLNQGELVLDNPIPPQVAAMIRLLGNGTKRQITEAFRLYASRAGEALQRAQADDMFGGAGVVGGTPDEAFDLAFAGGTPRVVAPEAGGVEGMPNLFDDPNVGLGKGQQGSLFDASDLETGTPRITPPALPGQPELPGKITPEEMAARRDELGNPKQDIPGADDEGQQLLLSPREPIVKFAEDSDGQPNPMPEVAQAKQGAKVVDVMVPEARALSDELRKTLSATDTPPAPADPVRAFQLQPPRKQLDENGQPIPRGLGKAFAREAGSAAAGAVLGASQGEDWQESLALGVAGGAAGLGAAKAGGSVVKIAKLAAAVRREAGSPQVKSLQTMVKTLADSFDIHTRFGVKHWLEMRKKERQTADGYFAFDFKKGIRVLRLRGAAELSIMAHEIGHVMHLDWRSLGESELGFMRAKGIDSDAAVNELFALGHALYGDGHKPDTYLKEGFAEWMRRYIRGEDATLESLTPHAHRTARLMLEQDPQRLAAVEQVRAEYQKWLAGTPYDRAFAQMAGTERKQKFVDIVRNWYDREIDTRNAMKDLGIDPDVRSNVKFKDNAYAKRRMAARAAGEASHALTHGVSDDLTGAYLSRPLQSVFEALEPDEIQRFQLYLYAERTLELHQRSYTTPEGRVVQLPPVNSGMDLTDAGRIVAENRATYEPLAKIIWEHQAAMIDLRVRSGSMTPEEGALIKQTNQKHVPLYRVFDPETTNVKGNGAGSSYSANGLPRIKGSDRMIEPPLESIIQDTFRTYAHVRRHQAMAQLIKDQREAGAQGAGRALALLPGMDPIVRKQRINAKYAARQLEALGWPSVQELKDAGFDDIEDQLEMLADAEVTGWRAEEKKVPDAIDRRELITPVMVDGKRQWVQFREKDLYDAYMGAHDDATNALTTGFVGSFLKGSTDLFRQSATLTPSFIKRNPVRDAWQAMRRTNKDGIPIPAEHLIRGLGVLIDHYANGRATVRPLPPPGASRVLEQLRRQADRGFRATLRSSVGTSALGAGAGALQGDTMEERLEYAALGALAGAAAGRAAKSARVVDPTSGVSTDLYEMWIQRGGGGVTLAGQDIGNPERAINEMLTSSLAKKMVVLHPVQALRTVAQISETVTRLGEMQIVMRQQLKMGNNLSDAKAAALMSAAEITQDFTKGGRLAMAWNQLLPFFNAGLVGKGDLARDMQDPKRLKRMLATITIPSLALWAAQTGDPEYDDVPQHEKDNGWVLIWPPKNVRDLAAAVQEDPEMRTIFPRSVLSYLDEQYELGPTRYVIPKPFEAGVLFGSATERALESVVRMVDDDPTTEVAAPGAGYKLGDMILNLIQPGSLPPIVGTGVDLAMNRDFTGRPIIPEYLKNRPAEDQATSRTGETARTIAKVTGIPAGMIDYAVTGVAGPMAQVPLTISDAAVREVREQAGKAPMRDEPRDGWGALPRSWGRAFEKGELAGSGANLGALYETMAKAQGKWASRSDAISEGDRDRQRELEADPLVGLYGTEEYGGGRPGKLRDAGKQLRAWREERLAAIKRGDSQRAKEIERRMTLYARDVMKGVARARSDE